MYPGYDEQSWNTAYGQPGLGTLRYSRYPGDDEHSWNTGYWQMGLGTLRYKLFGAGLKYP